MTTPKIDVGRLRVTKKLSPSSPGAIKLARQFGDNFVCARHRTDDQGIYRYTTVELLVNVSRIEPRADTHVNVRIGFDEKPLQRVVRAAGGKWDAKACLWRMSRKAAGVLRLTDRIVEK